MSRSGYTEDHDNDWQWIMWRGAVASATYGKRGQKLFRDLLAALDALEPKCLIQEDLARDGAVCALGALGVARGLNMDGINPEDRDRIADMFDIAPALAAEIMWMNDEGALYSGTPEDLFVKMREWVVKQIKETP